MVGPNPQIGYTTLVKGGPLHEMAPIYTVRPTVPDCYLFRAGTGIVCGWVCSRADGNAGGGAADLCANHVLAAECAEKAAQSLTKIPQLAIFIIFVIITI
ncbi:hypothetical protein D3C80_1413540 [compost metagenome]